MALFDTNLIQGDVTYILLKRDSLLIPCSLITLAPNQLLKGLKTCIFCEWNSSLSMLIGSLSQTKRGQHHLKVKSSWTISPSDHRTLKTLRALNQSNKNLFLENRIKYTLSSPASSSIWPSLGRKLKGLLIFTEIPNELRFMGCEMRWCPLGLKIWTQMCPTMGVCVFE